MTATSCEQLRLSNDNHLDHLCSPSRLANKYTQGLTLNYKRQTTTTGLVAIRCSTKTRYSTALLALVSVSQCALHTSIFTPSWLVDSIPTLNYPNIHIVSCPIIFTSHRLLFRSFRFKYQRLAYNKTPMLRPSRRLRRRRRRKPEPRLEARRIATRR